MVKRALGAAAVTLVLIVAVWTSLVVSYEDGRGTNNRIAALQSTSLTAETDDLLTTLSFEESTEPLLWSSLEIRVEVDGTVHACGFGAQSIQSEANDLVQPSLGVDGTTFTTVVDATDEASFTYLDLPNQRATDEANATIRFSKTDVFLGSTVAWSFLEGVPFAEVIAINGTELSNETSERLEWYDYDLAVHRITPKDGTYVLEVDDVHYKLQFVTYYSADDEARYPTMLIGALNASVFPALSDPALVSPSACLVVAGDGDLVQWDENETVQLVEQDAQIAIDGDEVVVVVVYEGKAVRIVENQVREQGE
ncbi:MAG: HmuY family protein [Poseidonia sp.]|jgi:hypothetical protein